MSNKLKIICEQAIVEGQKIDLSDCIYGESHWKAPFVNEPLNYYYFLAGLVRIQELACVLEIGTHFGGSIMSMDRGLSGVDLNRICLVTVDVTNKNSEGFKKYPQIKRIQGDALDKNVSEKVISSFPGSIDLLFIDSIHEYEHVAKCIKEYGNSLKPKYILLDDIYFNFSMKLLWYRLVKEFKNDAFDATDIIKRAAGFGVINCEYPMNVFDNFDYVATLYFKLKKLKRKIIDFAGLDPEGGV